MNVPHGATRPRFGACLGALMNLPDGAARPRSATRRGALVSWPNRQAGANEESIVAFTAGSGAGRVRRAARAGVDS
jgi:hypothetical protein